MTWGNYTRMLRANQEPPELELQCVNAENHSNRPVYISGIGFHPFGRHHQKTLRELAQVAALAAIDDAGIKTGDLDVAVCSNAFAGVLNDMENIRGHIWLRALGIADIPIFNTESACASGSSAVHLAMLSLRSGAYDTALVVGAEKMNLNDTPRIIRALSASCDLEAMGGIGIQFSAVDAIRVRELMKQEDIGEDVLEWITVKSHENGVNNPIAQYRKAVTAEEVRASRIIADPIKLLMCSAISDGAAAMVLTTRRPPNPIQVVASAAASSPFKERPEALSIAVGASQRAYEMAGLGPEDIDLVEVHDAVSPAELIYYRDLGFAAPGEVAKFVQEGRPAINGQVPFNPSGGINSRGHPIGATGVAQIAECVHQLRGTAGTQVEGARTALIHNAGGWMGHGPASCNIHILQKG